MPEEITIKTNKKQWLLVTGLNNIDSLEFIANKFNIHNLLLEDILNNQQRPKAENIEETIFLTLDYLKLVEGFIIKEQISFWWQEQTHTLIVFCENEHHPFIKIIERFESSKSRIRKLGINYLVYCLLDKIIKHYSSTLSIFEEKLNFLHENLIKDEEIDKLKELHELKTQLLTLRKSLSPLGELILILKEFFIGKDQIYLQDLKDHMIQNQENTKSYIEQVDGLFNLYFSIVGLRTNKIMQTLTIITLIFLPLSLLAGIYGMNFKNIPELEWYYGYPLLIGVMISISLAILWFFQRKRWF